MADIFEKLEKLITEHGSADILRQHVELLREQTRFLEKENADLKDRETFLLAENKKHEAKAKELNKVGFREYRGLLWKHEGEGYEPAPYCLRCKAPMHEFPPGDHLYWCCSSCDSTITWIQPPKREF